MVVGFTYNVKPEGDKVGLEHEMEYDSWETIESVKRAIEANGHEVIMIEAGLDAFETLRQNKSRIGLVFNMAEGLPGDARESQIPVYCELLGIPYTHSGPTAMAVKLDKHLAKQVVLANGLLAPRGWVVRHGDVSKMAVTPIQFPVIVKPNNEGSSMGVFDKSVVSSFEDIQIRVAELQAAGVSEVVVEEYIDGREFTVSLLGNVPEVLPIIEQRFDFLPEGMHKIAGYEVKWIYETQMKDISEAYTCPAPLSREQEKLISSTAQKIFALLNLKDICRIDFRMTRDGKLYFIEVNTIPGLIEDPVAPSYFVYSAYTAGMTYVEMIRRILTSAIERWGL